MGIMMSEPIKVIVDGDEVIERPFTKDEFSQYEIDQANAEIFLAEIQEKEAAFAAQRKATLAKLAALGLELEDLTALGL